MRNPMFIAACLLAGHLHAQSKLTLGQYAYIMGHETSYVSPVIQYQNSRHWYAEARYNYEDMHTFSLYAGRTFSGDHTISYTITPMLGGMVGKLQGGSLGLTASLNYKKIYCSTQSQYILSARDHTDNFFFSWSEAGYHLLKCLDAGLSLQHTIYSEGNALSQPGVFACYSFRRWSFPVYCFLPAHEPCFFVAGITYEWKYSGGKHGATGKPAVPNRGRRIAN